MAENKQQQQLKAITEKLEQGLKDLFDSETYKEYLNTMSKFHNYSFSNTLLIAMQKPDATLVAGYGAWQKKFGRHVMKDEKSIKIIAPAPYKVQVERDVLDPETKKPVLDEFGEPLKETVTVQRPRFTVASVFDVSQTDGKPLPELEVHDLTDSVEAYDQFFEALKRTSKVPIAFEEISGSSHGYYHQVDKRIAIREGMAQAQNVKTAIHEIAHSRLHDVDMLEAENGIKVDQRTREVQAESVAYAVCQYYKLDTSEYSFGYIAGWSSGQEMKELKSSLETIRREADSMITEIDGHLRELSKEKEAKLEQENDTDMSIEKENAPEMSKGETHNDPEKSITSDDAPKLSKQQEQKGSLTFYAAECMEYPNYGEFHEGLTLREALEIYRRIPDDAGMGKGIGFDLQNGGDYDGQFPLMSRGRVLASDINDIGYFRGEPLVQKAISDVRETMAEMGIKEIREREPEEAVLKVGGMYLHMQRASDTSWDYTIYDRNFRENDGGQIGTGDMTFDTARSEIMEMHQIRTSGNIQSYSIGQFEQMKQEHINGLKSPVYPYSFEQAKDRGEVTEFRQNREATIECAEQFTKEFGLAYHDRKMPEFLNMMVDRYGMDRCKQVLASTIQLAEHDGRYYPSVKEAAAKVIIPGADNQDHSSDIRLSYYTNCHPVMVNAAFQSLCSMEKEKQAAVNADRPAGKPSVMEKLEAKKKQVESAKQKPSVTQDKKKEAELG
ncbi:MAG: DUF3849 domain-containing protein [Clostridiales bacterium]|nr:DUF3849 domain-containing protein [Clostridiales bacterium]